MNINVYRCTLLLWYVVIMYIKELCIYYVCIQFKNVDVMDPSFIMFSQFNPRLLPSMQQYVCVCACVRPAIWSNFFGWNIDFSRTTQIYEILKYMISNVFSNSYWLILGQGPSWEFSNFKLYCDLPQTLPQTEAPEWSGGSSHCEFLGMISHQCWNWFLHQMCKDQAEAQPMRTNQTNPPEMLGRVRYPLSSG